MSATLPHGGFFSRLAPSDRLWVLLIASFVLHLGAVFGVSFKFPQPKIAPSNPHAIEVVLVNKKSANRPSHAEVYAQANLEGGGTLETDRRAKSPLPMLEENQEMAVSQKQRRVLELEERTRQLASQIKTADKMESRSTRRNSPSPHLSAADLIQSSHDTIRLQAQIDRDLDNYNKRPRKVSIGATAKEYVLARYLEDWRMKVEKVGNLNYPEEAKRQKLYGSLMLTVEINADGGVRTVELNRSSGHPVLDQAAMRIVRLAAPYAPFSADIRRNYDVVSITRTWAFTRADELRSR